MGEMIFSPSDRIKLKRVASELEPQDILKEYLDCFIEYQTYCRKVSFSDPTATALFQRLKLLASRLQPKKKSARKHGQEVVVEMLSVARRLMTEKLITQHNNGRSRQITNELRGIIGDSTFQKVS